MLRLVMIVQRVLDALRMSGAALVCALGVVMLGRVLGRHNPLEHWLAWDLLPIWFYTLLFNAACVSAGSGVLRLLFGRRQLPGLEWLLYSMAIGLVVFVLGMYAVGAVCAFKSVTALVLPALMLAMGARSLPGLLAALSRWSASSKPLSSGARSAAFVAAGLGAACLVLLYLGALPISTFNFDSRWYHYPTAQDYARIGCIVPFPGEHHRAYPHLTSLVHTWALLVPWLEPLQTHWMLSLHLEYSIVVWRVIAVATAVAWMLRWRRIPGLWAAFFLFPSVFVYDQNIGGSADHFLGFFAVPIALAVARLLRRFEWRWGVVLGLVLGGHLLTKYQAVFVLLAVGGVCGARWMYAVAQHALRARRSRSSLPSRRRWRRLWLGPAVALGMTCAVFSPHLVKNAAFYNNPFYPQARSVFKNSTPKPEPGSEKQKADRSGFDPKASGIDRQLWSLKMLYEYSFTTRNRDFTDKKPYMGALFSLLLPCLPFVRRSRRIWFFAAMGSLAFLAYASIRPNDRYMLGFYDLLIAPAGALLVSVWELGWLARLGVTALAGLQLLWSGQTILHYGGKNLRDALELVSKSYAGKSAIDRSPTPQQKVTAATPKDAVILVRSYRNLLGLDRMVVSDVRAGQFYISYTGLRDARQLWEMLHERGITHLLYPDGERVPTRLNNSVLFAELFHRHATNVQRFSGLVLGTLPTKAPPPTAPLLVLTRGVSGYGDGIHPVETLDVDQPRGGSSKKPRARYSDETALQLLEEAQAVAAAPGARWSSQAQSVLDDKFHMAERFKPYAVYLRR
jgi:hypothetical protein